MSKPQVALLGTRTCRINSHAHFTMEHPAAHPREAAADYSHSCHNTGTRHPNVHKSR